MSCRPPETAEMELEEAIITVLLAVGMIVLAATTILIFF